MVRSAHPQVLEKQSLPRPAGHRLPDSQPSWERRQDWGHHLWGGRPWVAGAGIAEETWLVAVSPCFSLWRPYLSPVLERRERERESGDGWREAGVLEGRIKEEVKVSDRRPFWSRPLPKPNSSSQGIPYPCVCVGGEGVGTGAAPSLLESVCQCLPAVYGK